MEIKQVLKNLTKMMEVPKHLHPEEVPDDALMVGQMAGVVKVWAQNGHIYDVIEADGHTRKVHEKDISQVVFNLIAAKLEKIEEKSIKKEAVASTIEEKAVEEPKPKKKKAVKKEVVVDDEAEEAPKEEEEDQG